MKVLLLSVCILFSAIAQAQQLSQYNLGELQIKPTTNDLTRVIQTDCTENGDAKIVFFTRIRGLKFQSTSGINEIDSLPESNRYTLCVDPNVTHILTITSGEFIEKKYTVNKLQTKEVVQFVITPLEDYSKPLDTVYNGEYYLTSTPSGALIQIDGLPAFKETTPFKFKGYEARLYNLQLSLENYKTEKVQINMSSSVPGSKTVALTPLKGFLSVTAENGAANGAVILLDNEPIGNVPLLNHRINQRTYNLVIEKKGFSTVMQQITVKENKTVTVTVKMFPTKQVVVTANIYKARIFIDGKYVGKTRLEYDLGMGKHKILIEKDNYLPDSTTIEIKEVSPNTQTVSFNNMQERLYAVRVNTRPNNVKVLLDGSYYSSSPANVYTTTGMHTFKLKKPGYFTRSIVKYVNTHNTSRINKNMFPKNLISLNAIYGLQSWGGELGIMGGNLSVAVGWLPRMKHNFYPEQPNTNFIIPDYIGSSLSANGRVPAKDTAGYGLVFKGGISFGRPIPTRIHVGYAIRKIYYNNAYKADVDFDLEDGYGRKTHVSSGEVLRGNTIYEEELEYYVVGMQVCLFRYFNVSADYWYNERQSDIVVGAGVNIF